MSKLIYVAGKYTGVTREEVDDNIVDADEWGRLVALSGFTPIIPHNNTAHWDMDERFKHWAHGDWIEKVCYPVLAKCDGIFMCPNWVHSTGAKMEYIFAKERKIPVFYTVKEIVMHFKSR